MSWQVIALVDEGKPTWTSVALSAHATQADCMADYRRQKRVFQEGGFDADVKGISVELERPEGPGPASP